MFRFNLPLAGSVFLLMAFATFPLPAQQISGIARQQMADLLAVKHSLTRSQRKLSSNLIFASMKARNQSFGALSGELLAKNPSLAASDVVVEIKANSTSRAMAHVNAVGGTVLFASASDSTIQARVPLLALETIAASNAVRTIATPSPAKTNKVGVRSLSPFIGAVTTQGYVTHTANQAVPLGFDGTGVRVGVLSDSASARRVATLIASGDLPSDVVVLPGQDGGNGSDEGAAMMEIVHDMAPGAKLFFATAFAGEQSFAANIRSLRFTYHCDIIVDDVTYFDEPVFQDGAVARAVNDVAADGGLFFSSAANNGNLTHGTSGTWEGDFNPGSDAGFPIDSLEHASVAAHNFGSPDAPMLFDILTASTPYVALKWSDPAGASANDYDLFVLDPTGTRVLGASMSVQDGTQNPYEFAYVLSNYGANFPIGSQIVIVLSSGAPRALHLETEGGRLFVATSGSTFGHNAALNTVSMAATAWNSAHQGAAVFTATNPTESFDSDGPRTMFYNADGTSITPGNFLFTTSGGQTLQKPDLTAADGVFTKTPGFLPFYGTSAAAPHAAGVAALIKSANPALSSTQIRQIMINTAVDNMSPGPDRDAGYGITLAIPAVQAALQP